MNVPVLRRIALSLGAAALLCGCVSSEPDRPVSNKDAAALNVKLGVEYMKKDQLQLAKEKLDRAEKQDPDNFEMHWAQAQLAELIDLPKEAEGHYQTAMRLSPGNSNLANIYAVFLCKSGNVDKALPLYDGVIRDRLYPTPWVAATNAAVCLRADKRNADAAKYLESALTQRADYIPAAIEMAELQLGLGKGAVARQYVDGFLSLNRKPPELPQLLIIGVRAALLQGDRAAADGYARLLRRDYPGSPQSQALAQLLQAAG